MLIDGGKPMRQNQWKKAGLTVLSAVFMGSLSIAAADTGIPALAATKDVAVTEYDEAALEKFKDNTLSQCLQMAVENNLSLQKSRNEIAKGKYSISDRLSQESVPGTNSP